MQQNTPTAADIEAPSFYDAYLNDILGRAA